MQFFSLGVLVNGQLFTSNCAEVGGLKIDWKKFPTFSKNTFIGIVIVGGICLISTQFEIGRIALPLLELFLYFISILIHQKNLKQKKVIGHFDLSKFHEFSSNHENIVLFVSDTFSSAAFKKLLEEKKIDVSKLNGFTYFNNTTSASSTTSLSVPVILTGRRYIHGETNLQFLHNAFHSEGSLPQRLVSAGFQTQACSACEAVILKDPKIFNNYKLSPVKPAIIFRETIELLDFGIFRSVPIILKRLVYRNQRWLFTSLTNKSGAETIESNPDNGLPWIKSELFFQKHIVSRITPVESSQPFFKFIHLAGAHPPFWVGSDGKEKIAGEFDETVEGFHAQAEYCFQGFLDFFEQLRHKGLCKNTTIIFTGDHGFIGEETIPMTQEEVQANHARALGTPLLLSFSPIQANEAFHINSIPAELSDIPRTLLESSNLVCNIGENLLTSKLHQRNRYFSYLLQSPTWEMDQIPGAMIDFTVNDNVNNIESWVRHEKIVDTPIIGRGMKINTMFLANKIFEMAENGDLVQHGAYPNIYSWCWTSKYFVLKTKVKIINIEQCYVLFDIENVFDQEIETKVLINKNNSFSITIPQGRHFLKFPINGNIKIDGVSIELQFLKFYFLNTFHHKYTNREIGIRFFGAAIVTESHLEFMQKNWSNQFQSDCIQIGRDYAVKKNQDVDRFLLDGWKEPENSSTWSSGTRSILLFPFSGFDNSKKWITLSLKLNPLCLLGKLDFQTVHISANQQHLASWHVTLLDWYTVQVPSTLITDNCLRLELNIPSARSLAELGVNDDTTVLGVQLIEFTLSQLAPIQFNDILQFGTDLPSQKYLVSGWKKPEAEFVWSTTNHSVLWLPLEEQINRNTWTLLRLYISPLKKLGQLNSQKVIITIAGNEVANWCVEKAAWHELKLPQKLLKNGAFVLEFSFPQRHHLLP